jgi:DNA (cytosine-5)-methyltransferase 1
MNFIELCAGAGGISNGFINNNFNPLLLVDIDKSCCETLKANHPNVNIIQNDFTKIDWDEYIGKVDLLIGGINCQSFSVAGKKEGLNDPRGNLLLEFIKLIEKIKPKAFLIENVKGLLIHDNGKTFSLILEKIKEIKLFKIYYKVLNANDYNVPQKRERLFIIGILNTINKEFNFPTKCEYKPILNDVLHNVPISLGYKYSAAKFKIMKLVPEGGNWKNLSEEIQKQYMGKSFTSTGGKTGIARKLSMNKPCPTLTTSPSQKQTERCHPLEIRPLNIREYARIQTFPDEYQFKGSIANCYKQIGNAVPVKLAEFIAKEIKKTLANQ